jgi:hypothetical protein
VEPAIELALRVTAHLWILRHVFPEKHNVADLPADWVEQIKAFAAQDFALSRQIADLAPDPRDGGGRTPGMTSFLQALVPEPMSAPRCPRSDVRPSLSAKREEAIERFCAHLLELSVEDREPATRGRFARETLKFRGIRAEAGTEADTVEDVSRDEVIDSLAGKLLLDSVLMVHVSQTLGYVPELAKQSSALEGNQWTDPTVLTDLADKAEKPIPFSLVHREELKEIGRSRHRRFTDFFESTLGISPPDFHFEPDRTLPAKQAFAQGMVGLALSGGGIRSATFALGVLQSIADSRLLCFVDYLSTVSGGGYIGSWILAWTKRRGSIQSVQDSLRGRARECAGSNGSGERDKVTPPPPTSRPADPMTDDVRPIRYLRDFSKYLAPQSGFFSADSWTILSTWLRNTLLNLLVLILLLCGVLMLPRVAATLLLRISSTGLGPVAISLGGGAFLLAACFLIAYGSLTSFSLQRGEEEKPMRGDSEPMIVSTIVVLILAGAFLLLAAIWTGLAYRDRWQLALVGAGIYILGVLVLWGGPIVMLSARGASVTGSKRLRIFWGLMRVILSGALGAALLYFLGLYFAELAKDTQKGTWVALTTGPCLIIGILSLVVIFFIGLMGTDLPEEQREWWSRLGGWLTILMGGWLIVSGICFFSPLWVAELGVKAAALGIGWGAITAYGVRLANSAASGRGDADNRCNSFVSLLMTLAPYAFVVGLLVLIAFGLHYGMGLALNTPLLARFLPDPQAHILCCTGSPFTFQRMIDNYWAIMYPYSWFALLAGAIFIGLSLIVSCRVDVNEFSMHNFYKNRLVRAYLGASRARLHRWPNAFTAFDLDDDLPLSRLRTDDPTREQDEWTDCKKGYSGPFPLINTALNITHGEDMARQERKAASFVFTPLRAGFDFTRKQAAEQQTAVAEYAYRPTKKYAFPDGGISVGTAIAISGAAANPNSGFHSTPALAFLLTVFNVRLGSWIGNTRERKWERSSPALGFAYLTNELLGQTQTDSKYVQLSDGGHFDNMGIYELVRRRCRFIVVCDGEEDGQFKLEGIGGAIRKCRVDFGVEIQLNLSLLQPQGSPAFSRMHYAVGSVRYPGEDECGVIVYIKATLKGDEPVDVVEFRKRFPAFPNESTLNQFFDESHFESYRSLGYHIGTQIFVDDGAVMLLRSNFDVKATIREVFSRIEAKYLAVKATLDSNMAAEGGQ